MKKIITLDGHDICNILKGKEIRLEDDYYNAIIINADLLDTKGLKLASIDNDVRCDTDYKKELAERLNHVVNVIFKRVEEEADFPVSDIEYLRECNSRLGISIPDSIEEGW